MKEGELVGAESFWNDEMVPFIAPPEELQCARNGGGGWRCSRWRIHAQKFCELHFLHQKFYANNRRKQKTLHLNQQKDNCDQSPSVLTRSKRKRGYSQQEKEEGISISDKEHRNDGEIEPWSRRTRSAKLAAEKLENASKPNVVYLFCLILNLKFVLSYGF